MSLLLVGVCRHQVSRVRHRSCRFGRLPSCAPTPGEFGAERVEVRLPEPAERVEPGVGRRERATGRRRTAAVRRRRGRSRTPPRAAHAGAARPRAARCRTPAGSTSPISPALSSPSASSSRIRRRTGSPRMSSACMRPVLRRYLYKSRRDMGGGRRMSPCPPTPLRSRPSRSSAPDRWAARSSRAWCARASRPPASRSRTARAAKADALAELDGVTSIALEERPDGNAEAAASARIVLIGVKPAMVPDLLREIAPHLRAGDDRREPRRGRHDRDVRVDPRARRGGAAVDAQHAGGRRPGGDGARGGNRARRPTTSRWCGALFETVGTVIEVPESQIDALSTISGSGPAYFFLLVEELTEGGGRQGIRRAPRRA